MVSAHSSAESLSARLLSPKSVDRVGLCYVGMYALLPRSFKIDAPDCFTVSDGPVPCKGVLNDVCDGGMYCYLGGTPNAECMGSPCYVDETTNRTFSPNDGYDLAGVPLNDRWSLGSGEEPPFKLYAASANASLFLSHFYVESPCLQTP
jgi:hypothetical protein